MNKSIMLGGSHVASLSLDAEDSHAILTIPSLGVEERASRDELAVLAHQIMELLGQEAGSPEDNLSRGLDAMGAPGLAQQQRDRLALTARLDQVEARVASLTRFATIHGYNDNA